MSSESRPLSPYQVYRWRIPNTLSILHRLTGIALFAGAVALVLWVYSVAGGLDSYSALAAWFGGPIGLLLVAGWLFSFYYHLANGIRHLFWDIGMGFDPQRSRLTGWAVVLFAIVSTAVSCFALVF